jgi:hypothetical protein
MYIISTVRGCNIQFSANLSKHLNVLDEFTQPELRAVIFFLLAY